MRGDDFERLAFGSFARGAESGPRLADAALGLFPIRRRVSLTRWREILRRLAAEVQQACLRAGVGFDLQRGIVLPGDVQAAGKAHDRGGSVGFADVAGGFVARGVPSFADALGFGREGDAGEITFGGSYHAPAPVFGNY